MMANDAPIGTPHAHYAGPEFAPFKCATCIHLSFPHFCSHPLVIEDAKAAKGGLSFSQGKAVIHLSGCCNYWRPRKG